MKIRKRTWTYEGQKTSAWHLDWRDTNGARHRRQFATKAEAEAFQKTVFTGKLTEEYGELLPDITVERFRNIYEQERPWRTETYRDRTIAALRVVPLRDRSIRSITRSDIEQYRRDRMAKHAASTVRQDLAALSDFFKWAVRLHYLRRNPCEGVEKPALPVKQDDPAGYLTPEQFSNLLGEADRDRPLYEFAVWTGARITELLKLEWRDVSEQGILIRRGKGRKQRLIPPIPQALEALKEVLRHLTDPRVFWWMRDRYTTLRRFKRRLEWAGLPSTFRFHDLRHTFGAYATQSGVDIRVIADAMGHSDTTVTKRYGHLSPSYKRAELLKMKIPKMDARRAQAGAKASKQKRT